MTIPDFDVALEVSKLKSPPAISAIPAIRQGENSKNSKNSSPALRLAPTTISKNSKNSKNSSPPPSNGHGVAIPIPTGPDPKGTGLEWVTWPTDDTAPDYGARWSAYDLADLGKLYGVRVVRAGERVLAVFQPDLPAELVAYATELLADARPYLVAHLDRLPILTPDDAVEIILGIMREHPGLRFCRGEGGSRWPLYPKRWTAGQKATVQALWFAAGDALDLDDFMGV
jgi:hypothetical protein